MTVNIQTQGVKFLKTYFESQESKEKPKDVITGISQPEFEKRREVFTKLNEGKSLFERKRATVLNSCERTNPVNSIDGSAESQKSAKGKEKVLDVAEKMPLPLVTDYELMPQHAPANEASDKGKEKLTQLTDSEYKPMPLALGKSYEATPVDERSMQNIEFFLTKLFENVQDRTGLEERVLSPHLKKEVVNEIIDSYAWYFSTLDLMRVIRQKLGTFTEPQKTMIFEFIYRLVMRSPNEITADVKDLIKIILDTEEDISYKQIRTVKKFNPNYQKIQYKTLILADFARSKITNAPVIKLVFEKPIGYTHIRNQIKSGHSCKREREIILKDLTDHSVRLLQALTPSHFVGMKYTNANERNNPKYKAVWDAINFTNQLTNFAVFETLRSKKIEKQANMFNFFMKLAIKAREQNNIQVSQCLFAALFGARMNENVELKQRVKKKYSDTYETAKQMDMDLALKLIPAKQFTMVREILKERKTCVPFLGGYTGSLEFLRTGNGLYKNGGKPNEDTIKLLADINNYLLDCQSCFFTPSQTPQTTILKRIAKIDTSFPEELDIAKLKRESIAISAEEKNSARL